MKDDSPQRSSLRTVVAASFIGTAIEWYDFFLYGTAAALVFNRLFFPTFDPVTGTMAAFATYAVGFVARPIGGIVFGHYGDRIGRKSMLIVTLVLVGLSTFAIGLLPTYDSIGIAAPILLVLLRFVQGFGVGGEWAGAVLMVVEHGSGPRRGYYASWVQAGSPVGLLLATIAFQSVAQLPEEQFLSWGWRIPFLFGIVLTGVGFFIRLKVIESPLFQEAIAKAKVPQLPIVEVIRNHPKNVLLAMGARMAENANFYFITVFGLSYATQQLQIPQSVMLNAIVLAAIAHAIVTPMFGALSDAVGRRPVYLGGAIFLAAFAFPFFELLAMQSTVAIYAAVILGLIGHAAMYGPQAAFLSELFDTRVRYTGASLGYQLAAPLSGGLAPLVATALLAWSGNDPWPVAVYMIALATITIVAIALAAETNRKELRA